MSINQVRALFAAVVLTTSAAAAVLASSAPAMAQGGPPCLRPPCMAQDEANAKAKADTGPTVTKDVAEHLAAAQKAMGSKDYKAALDDIHQAQAVADPTPFDTYKINQFLTYCRGQSGRQRHRRHRRRSSGRLARDAGFGQGRRHPERTSAFNERQAFRQGRDLRQDSPGRRRERTAQVQRRHHAGLLPVGRQYTDAAALAQKVVSATPAGQRPDRTALQILLSAQAQQKDEVARKKPSKRWSSPITIRRIGSSSSTSRSASKGLRDIDAIYLSRLMLRNRRQAVRLQDANLIASTASHLDLLRRRTRRGGERRDAGGGARPPRLRPTRRACRSRSRQRPSRAVNITSSSPRLSTAMAAMPTPKPPRARLSPRAVRPILPNRRWCSPWHWWPGK